MSRSRELSLVPLALAVMTLVGCAEGSTDTVAVDPALVAGRPVLAPCPTTEASSTQAVVDAGGGWLSLDGHSVYFSPGSVYEAVTVSLSVPASQFLEVDIKVDGRDGYRLRRPALATLSYERCPELGLSRRPLAVWHIDGSSKAPLERKGGLHDGEAQAVSFITNHFSGYAIAN